MVLGQVATSRESVRSDDDTFDTLLEEADLESPDGAEDLSEGAASTLDPQTPSKPLSLEEQNRDLCLQLEKAQAEIEYWKNKVNEKDKGIWENTMEGLRQFVSTPPDKMKMSEQMDNPGISVEFKRSDTGLHHRKSVTGGYFEKFKMSPFKVTDEEDRRSTSNTEKEEGVSLVKSHSSDYEREDESSIDSKEEDEQSFFHQLVDRGAWLVGLLVLQSFSSFIIQHNERLLQRHTVIVRFLTMLVGAGGNAGNQSSGKGGDVVLKDRCCLQSSYTLSAATFLVAIKLQFGEFHTFQSS